MSSNTPTWQQILEAIKAKAQEDVQGKVVPAVKTGRSICGKALVQLGNAIQPK